jgi:adenosylmethionine-8-amino-7-oxononanoate aminotransferase
MTTSAEPTGFFELAEWDHKYLWHPFTQMRDWLAQEPLIIVRGEGNYLIDAQGRRYLDGVSSLWCNVHGHRKPELDAALHAQIDRIAHTTMLGLSNVPAIELARRLVAIAPAGLTRVFYSDAGATAVEIALKLAYQYWHLKGQSQRDTFVSLTESYHGDTLGAVSVGYSEAFHRYFKPLLFPCERLNPPHVFRWQRGMSESQALAMAVQEAADLLAHRGDRIAALIVEPMMQGAAGMWSQPQGYLAALRELAHKAGTLLICDEVATGFGRTGKMFAVEHDRVSPDILCVGKGITGGYLPLAATLTSEEIFAAFLAPYEDLKTFFHGHTYTGNPLGCAVALANLELFGTERVIERVASRSTQLAQVLRSDFAPLAHVGDIRQWGLMVGIELVRNVTTRAPYDPAERVGAHVVERARALGVILRPLGNVIVLMPPLSITAEELATLCHVTRQAIDEVTR